METGQWCWSACCNKLRQSAVSFFGRVEGGAMDRWQEPGQAPESEHGQVWWPDDRTVPSSLPPDARYWAEKNPDEGPDWQDQPTWPGRPAHPEHDAANPMPPPLPEARDRKSTRLNSSHPS